MSLPHGGVDRNASFDVQHYRPKGRSLTGAWIETTNLDALPASLESLPHGGVDRNPIHLAPPELTPRSLPHGGVDRNQDRAAAAGAAVVAPSRGRGSKLLRPRYRVGGDEESLPHGGVDRNRRKLTSLRSTSSRSLTGAWIETVIYVDGNAAVSGRSLTGAWIETPAARPERRQARVAPSRGRGSKQKHALEKRYGSKSLPHGGVDRNIRPYRRPRDCDGSLPHGGVDRNIDVAAFYGQALGRSLTGAWIASPAGAAAAGALCPQAPAIDRDAAALIHIRPTVPARDQKGTRWRPQGRIPWLPPQLSADRRTSSRGT